VGFWKSFWKVNPSKFKIKYGTKMPGIFTDFKAKISL